MKIPLISKTFLAILFSALVVAKERKAQPMSTGETPTQFIQRKLDSHEVMVFARSYGKHNEKAKALLKQISKETSIAVEFLDLDLMPGWDGSLLMLELEELTGQFALPNIFIGKKHVGGNAQLEQKHALGELEQMVRNAGQEL